MEQCLDDFLRYLRFEKRFAPHTLQAYQLDLEQFSGYLSDVYSPNIQVSELTHFHVRSWIAHLKEQGMQAASLNRKLSTLRSFFRYLLSRRHISVNPVRKIPSQRLPERPPVFLKEKEATALLEEASFEEGFKGMTERLICELLYLAGLRRNELLQLKEQDIEWSGFRMRVLGKGNKERLIPLSGQMIERLRGYIREKKSLVKTDQDHLLVLENGEPLYPMFLYRTVKKYLTMVTTLKKKSPHILRHSFATHLLNRGANIQAIKELLGHSSLAATQVYTHNHIERLKSIHKASHPRG